MSTTIIPGPNVFTARSGSLFSTAANWSKGFVPSSSDAAVINDNCTIDISRTLGSLIVNAPFTASVNGGLNINVSQSFLVRGYVSMSSAAATTVFLFGKYNEIAGIAPGVSTFWYRGFTDQLLPGGPYYNLQTSWFNGVNVIASTKKATSNLIISGNLEINYGTIDLGRYDYYCSGSTRMAGGLGATLIKSQTGSVIFNGLLQNGSLGFPNYFVNFSNGNPTVEVRNGVDLYRYNTPNTGRGTWRFTTNNQSIRNTAGATVSITFDGPVSIENVALSVISDVNGNAIVNLNDVINGTTSTSQLLNSGSIYFNTARSLNSMTTGVFDYTSSNNTIGFTGDYSATIPSAYSNLRNLYISGTGIKSLGANMNISGGLSFINNASGILECGPFNLIVSGTTTTGNGSDSNYISKNSSGNITFLGPVVLGNAGRGFDFSGNPNVEFRNGLSSTNQAFGVNPNTGTGQWRFSTRNQSFAMAGSTFANMNASILIDGPITLSMDATIGFTSQMNVNNTIDGNNASSRLVLTNGAILVFNSSSNYIPMSTFGTFDPTRGGIHYLFSGSANLPYTNYGSLRIGGPGTKSLSGNTVLSGSLSYSGNTFGILECGPHNLIVSGTTTVGRASTLSKSGSGNMLFMGLLSSATDDNVGNQAIINFNGNPNVEFRGGLSFVNSSGQFTSGTGSFTFTTNNQNIDTNLSITFNSNIIISGAIVLTHFNSPGFSGNVIINGTLNGTEAGSIYRIAANTPALTTIYNNSAMPMSTGILDVSSSANATFIYGSGSQNIKGGIYRNLTMLSGSKTLQGNVSVLNTLNTGSGAGLATINLNGFTLTNP